jgi:hypothetical protein
MFQLLLLIILFSQHLLVLRIWKNRTGLPGSFSPTLPLFIAFATLDTAIFCPITLSCKAFSKFFSFVNSSSLILFVGIPVQFPITSAMSSSVISFTFLLFFSFHFCLFLFSSSLSLRSSSLTFAAFSKSCVWIASSFSLPQSFYFFFYFVQVFRSCIYFQFCFWRGFIY